MAVLLRDVSGGNEASETLELGRGTKVTTVGETMS